MFCDRATNSGILLLGNFAGRHTYLNFGGYHTYQIQLSAVDAQRERKAEDSQAKLVSIEEKKTTAGY